MPKKKKPAKKMVKIAKGVKISKKKAAKRKKKPGQGNLGKYPNVEKKDFAGPDGTYPINSISRGRSALKLAHNSPDEAKIKSRVYKKYPQLRPKDNNKK